MPFCAKNISEGGMKCFNCGDDNKESAVYCNTCGSKIGSLSPEEQKSPEYIKYQSRLQSEQESSEYLKYQNWLRAESEGAENSNTPKVLIPSGIGRRFLALLIDLFLILAVFIFFAVLVFLACYELFNIDGDNLVNSPFMQISQISGALLFYVYSILYFGILESSSMQATFGKFLLGIKVVNKEGKRMSLANSFARASLRIFASHVCCLGYIIALLNPEKLALHDIVASTRVVDAYGFGFSQLSHTREKF